MNTDLTNPDSCARLATFYRRTLVEDVMPFWLKHGLDHEHGGMMTCLDRDGSLLDTDKSVWFQGRAGWMFSTLYNTIEPRPEWLDAARSCVEFSRKHCHREDGKMWFSVTREGAPLRMRRYVFSEAFAAISYAAYAKATGDAGAAEDAAKAFATYLRYNFQPGVMPPKFEPTRPAKGVGGLMIGIVTAQELRANLGDIEISGKTCSAWIDAFIAEIERDFLKPEHEAMMETVAPDGGVIDHIDGRTLNPGHAIEAAWFIMHEGEFRQDRRLVEVGCKILDWMWARGWDSEHGGILYFTDLRGLPPQEYWQDMKFWWPHCEAIIATLLAWKLTGEARYAAMHAQVHDWSFAHFPDREHGEWYGWLHRDGTPAQRAKGNLFKGPFHLPRALWYCVRALSPETPAASLSCLPNVPDEHGFAGAFAGVHRGRLLAAGGANFPDGVMPWHGGKKVWHDRVFALDLEKPEAAWSEVGRLPAPNGYGVSLTAPEGVLHIGGGDAARNFSEVTLLTLDAEGSAAFRALPPLPVPLAQMCGALVGRVAHIVGGVETPTANTASNQHWSLDLDALDRGWREEPALPAAGRVLAVAAAVDGAFFVMAGCSLAPDAKGGVARSYLRDAWKFADGAWTRLADLPRAAVAAASPAPVAEGSLFVVSGDDGSRLGLASPDDHPGFTKEILRYDTAADRWSRAGELGVPAPVTLAVAPWRDGCIFFNGEVRHGVRSPQVFVFQPRC